MAKSAEDLLDWAWGFMCNAKPIIDAAEEQGDSWALEARWWNEAFEKFRPEFFAWLDEYAKRTL